MSPTSHLAHTFQSIHLADTFQSKIQINDMIALQKPPSPVKPEDLTTDCYDDTAVLSTAGPFYSTPALESRMIFESPDSVAAPLSLQVPLLQSRRSVNLRTQSFASRLPLICEAFGIAPEENSLRANDFRPVRLFDVPSLTIDQFEKVTTDVCDFPVLFNTPLFLRIRYQYHDGVDEEGKGEEEVVTIGMFKRFWNNEMAPYNQQERFFRLVKRPDRQFIYQEDFHLFLEVILHYHPDKDLEGIEHNATYQYYYLVTVITRIFYVVNCNRDGKITKRQICRSNLLDTFHAISNENSVSNDMEFFSYKHFQVLYQNFLRLDVEKKGYLDRRDLCSYGDRSLSKKIINRIFDFAPRPPPVVAVGENGINSNNYENTNRSREKMLYGDFIFFMLSEEDKYNEISIRYWFQCVGSNDSGIISKLEMRRFYEIQRLQINQYFEICTFEQILCVLIDLIKPASKDFFAINDFLQPESKLFSGVFFDSLFNSNKFVEFNEIKPLRYEYATQTFNDFAKVYHAALILEQEWRDQQLISEKINWLEPDLEKVEGVNDACFDGLIFYETSFSCPY